MAKVLCIDDNDTNLYMIATILRRVGYVVCTASNGEDGIAACRIEQPDLVLMDVQMPGIDGFEATRRIKDAPDIKHIPVIALSAHEADNKAAEIETCGCDAYLNKPLNIRRLLEEAARLLGQTRPAPVRAAGQELT